MPSKKRNRLSLVEQEKDNATEKGESLQVPSYLEGEERAFRCDFCIKAFHRKEHLQRHERLHTKEKPFHCTGCSAGFTRRDLLARHIRLTHEGDLVPHRDAEAGLAGDNEYPSLVRATPKGLHGGSPTGFTTQDQETLFETMNGPLSNATPAGNETLANPDPSALIHFALPPSASATVPLVSQGTSLDMPLAEAEDSNNFGDFDMFIDGLNGAYDSVMPSFYANQPILPSPSAPLFPALRSRPRSQSSYSGLSEGRVPTSTPHFFDEFTSTLPSFEPFPSSKAGKEPWKITQHDWDHLFIEAQKFVSSIPSGFFLPSRHTMTRYITTYFTGFHRHLPFIHLPTFSGVTCPVELILAMATIGAISAFDQENAVMLFRASFSIVQERLLHRKERRHEMLFRTRTATPRLPQSTEPSIDKISSTGTEQLEVDATNEQTDRFQPLPLAQTLLLLMAMATWGNSDAIFDEAVSIQNILVNYMRSEKLLEPQTSRGSTWNIWIQEEGFKRTVTIIFCFLVFHTIVYDLPPQILSSELNIRLPSRERDWEAQREEEWQEARREHGPEPHFQHFFSSLFSSHTDMIPEYCSSLGGYILILALIQHIYFLRSATQRKSEGERRLSPRDMDEIERALRNWQRGWDQDLESFLGPASPLGPISFNSTALLRMAYIRLNVDLGPWRALTTHDPHEVAISIHRSPSLTTNRRLTRAVLYSAHALSIPVKIGVNIVMHNQAFSWSLQHSLCALECAFIISKWLVAMQPHISEGATDEEEARLYAYIVDMVTEAEAGGKIKPPGPDLSTRVVRIWARILSGKAHWNVVSMIGKILEAYAQILEQQAVPTVTQ